MRSSRSDVDDAPLAKLTNHQQQHQQPSVEKQHAPPSASTSAKESGSGTGGSSQTVFNYEKEDRIRRENWRQEMRLRKSEDFSEQYRRCAANDAQKFLLPSQLYPLATCMDGSRPAYYLRRGTGSGAHRWMVFFEGGGWCYTLEACQQRMHTDLGSSLSYPEVS